MNSRQEQSLIDAALMVFMFTAGLMVGFLLGSAVLWSFGF